ncbi:SDR family oxidoreductase [Seohaeicola saemankumensis]|uniref:SDR family oxidoreductase n=1 Tax=Seohaeicola saemankumensis TaxID=481181 RepID=UPI0035CF4771
MRKVVWITGAGSGIGKAMAMHFAEAGYNLALTARNRQSLENVALTLPTPTQVHIAPGDVKDRDLMAETAMEITEKLGSLNVLCNNAGLNIPHRTWAELDWPSWDEVIEVNITGAMNVIAGALPAMRSTGGVMIHTSSWAGRFHSAIGGVPYGASKHALSSISASLNSEEGKNGIRSCALCPAEVATPLMKRRPEYDPSMAAAMIQPEDMAETAVFVAEMSPAVAVHEIVLAPVRR